jgi:inorganic pyrophosphatase
VRILGSIKMIDAGEIDTKLFAVFADDPRFTAFQTINDVPQHLKDEIQNSSCNTKHCKKKK